MQRTSFEDMPCPIARSLERVGEWWSMLILRDAFYGMTRFDDFQKSLGIAPNMLTRRLKGLVEAGVLERVRYTDRPPRYEYLLTERGRDFLPVLFVLTSWGNRHFAPEGASIVLKNAQTGKRIDPVVVNRHDGAPITWASCVFEGGPAATDRVRERVAAGNQRGAAKRQNTCSKRTGRRGCE